MPTLFTINPPASMRRHIFPLLTLLVLTSCGDNNKEAIQAAIKDRLKDPNSAQFKSVAISESGKRACTVWNSKNSFGGYGDWQVSELVNDGSRWIIAKMDGSESNCSESAFRTRDEIEALTPKLVDDLKRQGVERLKRNETVPAAEVDKISRGDSATASDIRRCVYVFMDLPNFGAQLAELQARKESTDLLDNKIKTTLDTLSSQFCLGSSGSMVTPRPGAEPATAVAEAAELDGKKVYAAACAACHGAGIAGAPRFGDTAAWAPRIKQGSATLYDHAIKGFAGKDGVMPARGGSSASDEAVKGAVDYMVSAVK